MVLKGGLRGQIEHGEANTVEANEALLGAEPQEAVARLKNGLDGVLGKPVFDREDRVAILGDGTARIQGGRKGRGGEEQAQARDEGGSRDPAARLRVRLPGFIDTNARKKHASR